MSSMHLLMYHLPPRYYQISSSPVATHSLPAGSSPPPRPQRHSIWNSSHPRWAVTDPYGRQSSFSRPILGRGWSFQLRHGGAYFRRQQYGQQQLVRIKLYVIEKGGTQLIAIKLG
ncbi:hypothetical protein FGO68_gene9112 [Halteria grandinella]|uniref:Uncharacterized protein n=1 Tax=Halteria grandinella TaxID=5974 RepID=A0A8J8NH26_HALGN|nr:hypothetical protein FGO68_gene9112 [Halteria grandinella]